MQPLIKWAGGKTQILDKVLDKFPTTIKTYHEPFVGGGSVLFGLLERVAEGKITLDACIASDLNPNLIYMYNNVKTRPEDVIRELATLVTEYKTCPTVKGQHKPTTKDEAMTSQETYYYWQRLQFNTTKDKSTPAATALLIFLNKTGFRGLYRESSKGALNIPFGHYVNPAIYNAEHIRAVSEMIQHVKFIHQDFKKALMSPRNGDFVYMDPPYVPETATSFVDYTKDGFGDKQHVELFTIIKAFKRGIGYLMSNSSAPAVLEAFPEERFVVERIECRRAINSKDPAAKTIEVLISRLST